MVRDPWTVASVCTGIENADRKWTGGPWIPGLDKLLAQLVVCVLFQQLLQAAVLDLFFGRVL